VAVIALLTACGPAPTPVANSSPTAVASPTANPTASPAAVLCDATHRCLALVRLRGSDSVVVRDVPDINHAVTIGSVGVVSPPAFAGSAYVAYADGARLLRAPLTGSPTVVVATNADLVNSPFAWSNDARFAYLTQTQTAITLHQVVDGKDSVVATGITPTPAVGCESEFCSLLDSADLTLSYSPDGKYISLVDHVASVSTFRIWASNGQALEAKDSQGLFMSAWSGDGLYFRDDRTGVLVWRNGTVSTFLPSSQWIYPEGSPAGGQIVYTTKDAQGWHHVFVVGTATGHVQEIKKGRNGARYLTSRYLWYTGERVCSASDNCPAAGDVVNNGKTYIYDLKTGIEYDSIITGLYDTWPHAA
jgi:hypothetical protein